MLAKYMDEGLLMLDAVLAGRRNEYDCPLTVGLYGTSDPAGRDALKQRMTKDRLPLDTFRQREKEEKKRKAAELKNVAKRGVQIREKKSTFTNTNNLSLADDEPSQTLDDIIVESQLFNSREMGEVAEKFGTGEDMLAKMPMADNPSRIATSLLPYQRQGLAWLLDRENLRLPPKGSKDVVQLWKRSAENANNFTNVATNFSVTSEPRLASGGILADDMGLGKTLELISLIVADMEMNKLEGSTGGKATLIIAPLSVMSNWSGQVRDV